MQRIEIEIKKIDQMRYPTVGDYFYKDDGTLKLEIADTGNPFFNKMILIHELIEQALTEQLGITEESITDFDLFYEMKRKQGLVDDKSEPGFDNDAPYLREHMLATSVEMIMCAYAGIKWKEYDNAINEL